MCVCVCVRHYPHQPRLQHIIRRNNMFAGKKGKENQMHRQVRERESGPPDDSSARNKRPGHNTRTPLIITTSHPLRLSLTPRNEISSQRVRYWHRVRMMSARTGLVPGNQTTDAKDTTLDWDADHEDGDDDDEDDGEKSGKKDWQSLSDGDEADNCYHVMQREERLLIPCPTSCPDQRRPNDRELLTDSAGTVVSLTHHQSQGCDEPESQCHCRRRG